MEWRYRGFTADGKAGTPRITTRPERVGRTIVGYRWNCDIDFQIQADSVSELEARIVAFETACIVDNGDWEWVYPGGTASVHSVRNGDTVGGIEIANGPSYPDPQPGEMTTFRNCSIGFTALLNKARIPNGTVLQIEETIETDNRLARPARVLVPLQRQPGVFVRPRLNGQASARQSGFVVAAGAYPSESAIPQPRWPEFHVPQDGGDTRRFPGPVRLDGIPAAYRIDYSYAFQFPGPIAGSLVPKVL